MTLTPVTPTSDFLPRSELDRLLDALRADGRTVVGPTIREGAVVYEEITHVEELPIGWRADSTPGAYRLERKGGDRAFDYGVGVTAWKRFTHPPRVPLTTSRAPMVWSSRSQPDAPRLAFLGVRACELAALGIQERVAARRAGGRRRPRRAARRVARRRGRVRRRRRRTCFCTSMGTGPEVDGGADIVLAELDDGFVVRAGPTPAGGRSSHRSTCRPATADRGATRPPTGRRGPRRRSATRSRPRACPNGFAAAPDHPRWAEVAERCLACANCTLVCPTCFCTSVGVASDLDGTVGDDGADLGQLLQRSASGGSPATQLPAAASATATASG